MCSGMFDHGYIHSVSICKRRIYEEFEDLLKHLPSLPHSLRSVFMCQELYVYSLSVCVHAGLKVQRSVTTRQSVQQSSIGQPGGSFWVISRLGTCATAPHMSSLG